MKKRILALFLCLALASGLAAPAWAFSDVSDPAESLAAETLAGLGIVSGDGSGNFSPSQNLTRAQFCKVAVLTEGHGSQVSSGAYKTLFSDVPGTSWAAPYINLAYGEKLVSGYGNGKFGPDDPVTVAQAVTVALHLLGYQNSAIGPFWPEDYLAKAADLGLLDGIDQTADRLITRGEMALLLYRLLGKNTAQGKPFCQSIAASSITDAVLLSSDATSGDGTPHTAMVYAAGAITCYSQTALLPAALEGERGVLLLDSSGRTMGFLPGSGVKRTVTVTDVDGATLNGVSIGGAVPLILDGTRASYQGRWYDLRKGDQVILYYNASGSVDLLWVKSRTAGAESTLIGYYEDATPNTTAPGTVTVLGATLPVTDAGRSALKAFSIGDRLTLTLNTENQVISAAAASSATAMAGILKSTNSQRAEAELLSGVAVSGKPDSTVSSSLVGALVQIRATAKGALSVSALPYTPPSLPLEQLKLSAHVKVYERVNGSVLTEISPDALPAHVSASAILHAGTNAAGEVAVLVVEDLTGASYTYGILRAGEQSGGSGELRYTNATVSVENGKGAGTAYITGLPFTDGAVGGVAGNSEGKAASIVILTAVEGLARTDFDGSDSIAGKPLAADVQVYNAVTGRWTTLPAAKAFTDSFTAYCDTHGTVRVLFAR